MTIIKIVSDGLSEKENYDELMEGFETGGDALEAYLIEASIALGKAGTVTGGLADMDSMLRMAGTYLMCLKRGDENLRTAAELYNEILFPFIDIENGVILTDKLNDAIEKAKAKEEDEDGNRED